MEKFAHGEIRILICTNIVESGLDIQNANTIIIQDVQQFGLAQLYQVLFNVHSVLLVYSFIMYKMDNVANYLFGGLGGGGERVTSLTITSSVLLLILLAEYLFEL